MHSSADGVQAPSSSFPRHNQDKGVRQEQVLLQGVLLSSGRTASALALAGLMCYRQQYMELCMGWSV